MEIILKDKIMKKILLTCFAALVILMANSCKQDELAPTVNDHTAPGPVSHVTVTDLNGAAKISYTIPADGDLLYIKAVYSIKKGDTRETKVSRYNSDLTVDGFGDTVAYLVKLYAVDKGENVSAPVEVTVHPLTAPLNLTRDSLTVTPDFGGINVKFTNSTKASLAIVVLATDSLGEFAPILTNYTNLQKGNQIWYLHPR
jgi:hypothetical protein